MWRSSLRHAREVRGLHTTKRKIHRRTASTLNVPSTLRSPCILHITHIAHTQHATCTAHSTPSTHCTAHTEHSAYGPAYSSYYAAKDTNKHPRPTTTAMMHAGYDSSVKKSEGRYYNREIEGTSVSTVPSNGKLWQVRWTDATIML